MQSQPAWTKSKKENTEVEQRNVRHSGRTREMIVIPRENLIEMEEKLKTLSESK